RRRDTFAATRPGRRPRPCAPDPTHRPGPIGGTVEGVPLRAADHLAGLHALDRHARCPRGAGPHGSAGPGVGRVIGVPIRRLVVLALVVAATPACSSGPGPRPAAQHFLDAWSKD